MMHTRSIKTFIATTTARLGLSYLAIIMLMSIGFSVVFYNASSQQLGRQIPPSYLYSDDHRGGEDRPQPRVDAFLQQRIVEGRHALLLRLLLLNLLALIVGGGLSYYLARRTLAPIAASMEAQSQFVSDASHELRTPLTAMQTMDEVALRNDKLTLGDAKTVISQNVDEVMKLKALTDGLLKLARQDTALAMPRAVSLQESASEALNALIALAQGKRIAVDDSVGATKVLGDPQSIVQILVILLDNAIKYSPKRSTVYLTSAAKGKYGLVSVRDEGPGIRPYDQRKIFDRFYRADQSRSKQIVDGHGIGLALARKIARQQGGDVSVASASGEGSTFTLKLPLA